MALKVWNGTAWTSASAIKVWNGTAWTSASSGKVWNGSAWVNFFGGLPILPQFNNTTYDIELSASYDDLEGQPGSATVEILLNNDGTGAYRYTTYTVPTTNFLSFTWLPSGDSASNYYAYMDAPAGNSFGGGSSATGSSLVLSTGRIWVLTSFVGTNPGSDEKSLASTLRIKNSSGTDLVARTLSMETFVTLGAA